MIVILAINKTYYQAAYNLAFSIKYHNPDIYITLLSDGNHTKYYLGQHYLVFNNIKTIDKEDYIHNGRFEPALAKLSLNKYVEQGTLYIDADSLCFKDLSTLKSNEFKAQFEGFGGVEDTINYQVWLSNKDMISTFGIPPQNKLYTINSSWMFVDNKVFDYARELFLTTNIDKDKLLNKWGGSLPDELYFNAALSLLNINPKLSDNICFFGGNYDSRMLSDIAEMYYLMTMYGNKNTTKLRYVEYYDKLLHVWHDRIGMEHYFKGSDIMPNKHINNK